MKKLLLLTCAYIFLMSMQLHANDDDYPPIQNTTHEIKLKFRDEGFYMVRMGKYALPRETFAFTPDGMGYNSSYKFSGRYEIISDTLYVFFPKRHYPLFKPVWIEPDGYQFKFVADCDGKLKLVFRNTGEKLTDNPVFTLEFMECKTPFKI